MLNIRQGTLTGTIVFGSLLFVAGCQGPATNTTVATNSTNVSSNTNFNSNSNTNTASAMSITTSEPNEFLANVKLTLETLDGGAQ